MHRPCMASEKAPRSQRGLEKAARGLSIPVQEKLPRTTGEYNQDLHIAHNRKAAFV